MQEIYNEKTKLFANKLKLMRSLYSCIDIENDEKFIYPNVIMLLI